MNLINNIAQELDCGMDCYYNPKTKELISLFGADLLATGDEDYYEEMFKEQINRVKAHKKDFIKIEVLERFESFKIMEKFKDEVPDLQLKEQLRNALADRKPFQNFKRLVDNSNFREDWFKFKVNEIENRVRKILEVNGVDVIH